MKLICRNSRVVCALAGLGLCLLGQSFLPGVQAQVNPVVAEAFGRETPGVRFERVDSTTQVVYGTTLSEGDSPLASVIGFVNQWSGMLGRDIGEFQPHFDELGDFAYGLMIDRATGKYGLHALRLHQHYQGVPVFRAGIGAIVRNEPGHPLVMVSLNQRDFDGTGFRIDAAQKVRVTEAMRTSVTALMDAEAAERKGLVSGIRRALLPLETTDPELVIWAGIEDTPAPPEAAVTFMATRGSVATLPDYQKYLIVASVATGKILLAESQIHYQDVAGNASGRGTDGIRAAECDPVATQGLPYAEVQIVGGNTAYADVNGNFTIPYAGTGQVTVRSFMRGRYFDLRDNGNGSTTPQLDLVVNTPGPANILHNPTSTDQYLRANVNAYREANVVRDYVLLYQPGFPTIGTQLSFRINNNINSTCNAFYDGTSINFYRNGGGCNNTAFSDVVYHEYGHHLVAVTGNGQGQFGEGSGDCMGVLIQDEPLLGAGFSGNCSSGLRTANNTLQAPCSTSSHTCGQVLSGALWDTRNQLVVTEPANYRHIGARLFLGMLIARGQLFPSTTTINSNITLIYLVLDDNDGYLGNGTPHWNEIATGFGLHNLPAPARDPLAFQFPEGRPELMSPAGGNSFRVQATAVAASPQPGTGVLFVDRGSGFEQFNMTVLGNNDYRAVFPSSECGRVLKYYVRVQTTGGANVTSPIGAPASFYTVTSGTGATTLFSDNGETNPGWTVSGTATAGAWERGVPASGVIIGAPPTDADGSGQCWLTGNQSGGSDVDGGTTILTSPILSSGAAANDELHLSYWRWYSNHLGSNSQADTLVVQVSNNNGSTWTTLETVGPTGAEASGGWYRRTFRLKDTIATTNQMRVRFTAQDTGNASNIEAAVDGVKMTRVTCGPTSVPPSAFQVVVGENVQGGLTQLASSDDQRMSIESSVPPEMDATNNQEVRLVMESILPSTTPGSLSIRLEGHCTDALCTQRIELFNFQSGLYETVDTRVAGHNTDQVTDVTPTGNILRFVQGGTGLVRARVRFIQNPLVQEIVWFGRIDQFVWLVQ